MAKKNKEKEIKTGKGKAGILYALMMVVLIIVSVVLACTVFFRVEEVKVSGNQRYENDVILAASGINKGENLILTPAEQIENHIYRELPYVDVVEAQKWFPTTIRLIIKECQPVAVLPGATMVVNEEEEETLVETGEFWIIDSKGKVLEKVDPSAEGQYIRVEGLRIMDPEVGVSAQAEVTGQNRLTSLLSLLKALEEQSMVGSITGIDASLSTEISMVYEGRITCKLLANTNFSRKIQIFEEIVALTGEHEYRTVNLKGDIAFDSPSV